MTFRLDYNASSVYHRNRLSQITQIHDERVVFVYIISLSRHDEVRPRNGRGSYKATLGTAFFFSLVIFPVVSIAIGGTGGYWSGIQYGTELPNLG